MFTLTADQKAAMVITAAFMGSAAILLHIAAIALDLADFLRGLSIGLALVSLAILLIGKLRDEYLDGLWKQGASAAFATTVVLFLVRPFIIEGAFTGIDGARLGEAYAALVAPAAILAFFVGFYGARLRSHA